MTLVFQYDFFLCFGRGELYFIIYIFLEEILHRLAVSFGLSLSYKIVAVFTYFMCYLSLFRNADLQHLSVLELSDSTTPTSRRSGKMNELPQYRQCMTDNENADC